MAVTIAQLRELRAAGVKAVEFTAKGEISGCEFFSEVPEVGPAAVATVPEEPEIPPDYMQAFADVRRRAPIKKEPKS